MIIRLNGHEYQVDDIFSKKIKEVYNGKKNQIQQEMEQEINNTQKDFRSVEIKLPDDVTVNYSFNTVEEKDTLIIFLDDIYVKVEAKEVACDYKLWFDLKVYYLIENIIDSASYKLKFTNAGHKVSDFRDEAKPRIWYQPWNWLLCSDLVWNSENLGDVEGIIDKNVSKALIDTTFKILKFADLANDPVVLSTEVEALQNSFVMNGKLNISDGQLVININFMEGKNEKYKNVFPDPVPENHQLNFGGFAFLEHNLQRGFAWKNWNEYQRIDAAFNKMIEHGITACRVEARWDKIQRSNEVVLGKNPDQLTDVEIDNLMNNGAHEWDVLEYILNKADEKGIIIIMCLTSYHSKQYLC